MHELANAHSHTHTHTNAHRPTQPLSPLPLSHTHFTAKKGMLKAILKKTWKERWFVLKDGKLVMSDNPGDRVEEGKKKETLEMLNIKHVEKEEAGDGCKFSIISKTGSYFFFTCRSSRDAKEWKDSIEFAKADITKFSGKGKGGGNSAMLF